MQRFAGLNRMRKKMDCPFDNFTAFYWHERDVNRRRMQMQRGLVFADDPECEEYEDDEDEEFEV